VKTIVIDTMTAAERLATESLLKEHKWKTLEDAGYGKGYVMLGGKFAALIRAMEAHVLAGRNVVCVAHEQVNNVPNPEDANFLRYEPKLYDGRNVSLKRDMKDWADHVAFMYWDRAVGKDGKAKGGGTKSIATQELPHLIAKSRVFMGVLPINNQADATDFWSRITGVSNG